MTKREQYDELKKAGVKLRHINTLKPDEVAELYERHFGRNEPVGKTEHFTPAAGQTAEKQHQVTPARRQIPTLFFDHGGWCEKLRRSYVSGYYKPTSWDEYDALVGQSKAEQR